MQKYKILPAERLNQIDASQGIIIDVRTKMEHAEKRLATDHILMTLDKLNPTDFMMRQGLDKDFNVYILCRSGTRAAQAAEKFIKEGYTNVHVIEGGIEACADSGYELERHAANQKILNNIKRPMSLERQVRVVAGLIVALGALSALTVNSIFSLISLFVGAGLMFAGITDRCGMALVLTKAPWNKVRDENSGSCAIPEKDKSTNKEPSCQ